MNWGFESATVEGWAVDPSSTSSGVVNMSVSSTHAHTGTHSLAVSIAIAAYSSNDARGYSIIVPLCASGGANLAGYTFSAWVYFTVTAGTMPMNAANLIQAELFPSGAGSINTAIAVSQSTTGQWLQLTGSIVVASGPANQVAVLAEFPIADPNSEGFSGTMYLDDVQISPP